LSGLAGDAPRPVAEARFRPISPVERASPDRANIFVGCGKLPNVNVKAESARTVLASSPVHARARLGPRPEHAPSRPRAGPEQAPGTPGAGPELEIAGAIDAVVDRIGHMPLPPYISRPDLEADRERYQTVYARERGSVAAPTAGLHFTPQLLAAIEARGVRLYHVTLHVGAGTFLPVKADDTDLHRMHEEFARLDAETAQALNEVRAGGGRIVAVGTTALRVLESAADDAGRLAPYAARTRIFITPGYHFRAVDMLLTNFHLPRSTLFMLVAAFAGLERMKAVYAHAIESGYRFYSYGDACLLQRVEA
jgi:S-adenosylmethionine:tRNA ribosyltransferase-isomerase